MPTPPQSSPVCPQKDSSSSPPVLPPFPGKFLQGRLKTEDENQIKRVSHLCLRAGVKIHLQDLKTASLVLFWGGEKSRRNDRCSTCQMLKQRLQLSQCISCLNWRQHLLQCWWSSMCAGGHDCWLGFIPQETLYVAKLYFPSLFLEGLLRFHHLQPQVRCLSENWEFVGSLFLFRVRKNECILCKYRQIYRVFND